MTTLHQTTKCEIEKAEADLKLLERMLEGKYSALHIDTLSHVSFTSDENNTPER